VNPQETPNQQTPAPTGAPVTEAELRALLVRKAEQLTELLVSEGWRRLLKAQIEQHQWLYRLSESEAAYKRRRKAYSPDYQQFCKALVEAASREQLGPPLTQISRDNLITLEKMCDTFIAQMTGDPNKPQLEGPEVLGLMKYLMSPRKKRGPRMLAKYDEAFVRRMNGETISHIAQDLEPAAYKDDPYGTIQKYSAAIRLRKKRAARI